MSRATFTARGDASVASLITMLTDHHIGCIPIVDANRRPIGIVTKLDVVECRDEGRVTAREVMMPHAMTLHLEDSVAAAAALMSRESFHHVLVVDSDGVLVGVVSTLDITRYVARSADGA